MSDDYRRHLRERESQNYRSTRRWNPHPNVLGMIGEKALTEYFGIPQDLRNRPDGDHGVDLQLDLRDYGWVTLDAKASPYGDWLRVPKGEVKPKTIYVHVHAFEKTETGKCLGWLWGLTLMYTPAAAYFRGDVITHRWAADKLRDMKELTKRMIGWRHEPREAKR